MVNEVVFIGILYPHVVVSILKSSLRIDACHGGPVGHQQILFFPAEAHPAKGAVTVIEQQRPHDVFHIGRENKSIQGILAVFADFIDAGIEHRL
jgi:hypothetical protein